MSVNPKALAKKTLGKGKGEGNGIKLYQVKSHACVCAKSHEATFQIYPLVIHFSP
jgi:hypothetical protein